MVKQNIHILLIEDEKSYVELIRHSLKTHDDDVKLTVANGIHDALSRLSEFKPDLIISELHLPDGDASELFQIEPGIGECPVIVICAAEDEKSASEAMKSWAIDYVVKSGESISSLPHIVDRALHARDLIARRKTTEETLRKSENELRIMNRISSIFLECPGDEMYGEVLDVILDVMGSKHGVFGYIDKNGDLVCPSMTRDIFDKCQMPNKELRFPRETWGGLWKESLIEKKTIMSNKSFNVPEGHLPVTRALTVPVIYQEAVIGHINVGNKESDYDDEDICRLEKIAAQISPILNARLKQHEEEQERQKAQQSLKESEEKFRQLFENHADAIFWADPATGLIVNCNKAAEVLLEKKREEIIGQSQTSLHPPEKAEFYINQFKEHLAKKTIANDEAEVITKSGKIKTVMISATAISEPGNPVIQGVFRDITELKNSSIALRNRTNDLDEKVRELNCLFETSRILDSKDRSIEDKLNKIINILIEVWRCGCVAARLTVNDMTFQTANYRNTHKKQVNPIIVDNRTIGYLEVCCLKETCGLYKGQFINEKRNLINNISEQICSYMERHNAVEALRLFRTLLNNSGDALFVVDPKTGQFLDVNERACSVLGYTRDELLIKKVTDINAAITDLDAWNKQIKNIMKKRGAIHEGIHVRKDGTTFPVEINNRIVTVNEKDYLIRIVRDIT